MGETVTIIGVDCAVQPERTGLARGRLVKAGDSLIVDEVLMGARKLDRAGVIDQWIRAAGGTVLLAMDAPLGWPAAMAEALGQHRAGERVDVAADELFTRLTDRRAGELGRRPLEVGADRIARTALAALELLAAIGRLQGRPIPLAWKSGRSPRGALEAIEVYPAATLRAHGVAPRGYKRGDGAARCRARIANSLRARGVLRLAPAKQLEAALLATDDTLDAALCLVAGADFLRGGASLVAPRPDELATARREGWIWFKRPAAELRSFAE